MTPTVTLISAKAVKWPRYHVLLEPGMRYRDALRATYDALRTEKDPRVIVSRFSYDAGTGLVDTRVDRSGYWKG
jgi:hypothetical protein